MNREERNILVSVVVAGVVSLVLCASSAYYLDRVLGGFLRGTDWDFLLFPGVVVVVLGPMWLWYVVYMKVFNWLEKR
ncbi:hypothetical protein HBA54_27695 [Pelagibius litoralis]|uniref:Uncharacterized protein n=1 Tax=Pelagibius litoralis TaxID=374515 RepID=A0A967F3K3_9PROT|nr:hypothetical protein [Pelagibius litoralis]NIA72377.1 hypothetical protein [Pelagibius litoralis]